MKSNIFKIKKVKTKKKNNSNVIVTFVTKISINKLTEKNFKSYKFPKKIKKKNLQKKFLITT